MTKRDPEQLQQQAMTEVQANLAFKIDGHSLHLLNPRTGVALVHDMEDEREWLLYKHHLTVHYFGRKRARVYRGRRMELMMEYHHWLFSEELIAGILASGGARIHLNSAMPL